MSKAEDRALEAFPLKNDGDSRGSYDSNIVKRIIYKQGYEQAEKDLELTWEDIAGILDVTDVIANDDSMEECLKTMSEEEYCQEILKRFKENKL